MKSIDWKSLSASEQTRILQRPQTHVTQTAQVDRIIQSVRSQGDRACLQWTAELDRCELESLAVSQEAIDAADTQLSEADRVAIDCAIERIELVQRAFKPQSGASITSDGVTCSREWRPINRVGLYVPGGSAPLISTVMMLAIPAAIAGCRQRIICTPPQPNGRVSPVLLATAKRCGVQAVYSIGGVQAIAAMAYGTESLPKVDKIFGPGNGWVTAAKQWVSQDPAGAAIDMPAGPSEILIISDGSTCPSFLAADLLSQAEHGPDSQVILVSTNKESASAVIEELDKQVLLLSRVSIAKEALKQSRVIVTDSITEAVAISNRYAPEHLSLQVADPETILPMIEKAGAVFLGPWSAETMGDYVNGSNHVLPTNGYAAAYSGLSVSDFMTAISVQSVSAEGLDRLGDSAVRLAEIEGLTAHASAVSTRLAYLRQEVTP